MANPTDHLIITEEVQTALASGKAVVALESTVLTHGLPYPQNMEILHTLESTLRAEEVTPATIIVWQGKVQVGLDGKLLATLSQSFGNGETFHKLSWRDLPLALGRKDSGGTTVSATMKLAQLAGIGIFATGGIGGVHRGWQTSLDISSDLRALAELPVTVVSAGCKAILDIPATLEYLETLAVPVLGWKTSSFPLFYTAQSAYPIERIDSLEEFVGVHRLHRQFSNSGILIANPIPAEHSISEEVIEPVIEAGIAAAQEKNIAGKALTPFLLDFLAQRTKGESVAANLALLKNNVRVAALLAKALCDAEG